MSLRKGMPGAIILLLVLLSHGTKREPSQVVSSAGTRYLSMPDAL